MDGIDPGMSETISDPLTEISATNIAIIGMAGRFPGAKNVEEYWDNLQAGREGIKFFSDDELKAAGVPAYQLKQANYVKAGGVLDDAELFDANFFGFSPKEAQIIDPQHRLFLEQAWTALEHAGYNSNTYRGAIGVYVGVGMNTYLLRSLYPHLLTSAELDSYQVQIRNDKDFLPTLVSYKLNLRGPSLSVQTACSTSLVAVHLACQSLLNGECDMALSGGVTVFVNPTGYVYSEGMILSPDGHCRAFDAKAQGTVGGNGVGVVVLKRLADAIGDRDTIYAVIKGSAVNNDGTAKVGYTAPSIEGQAAVITEAQAIADTPADTISYVETHGTGTTLGDPIEIAALTQAFRHTTTKNQFCAIGSVKTNIGHLDTAAGVASLIKVALALKHKAIPPSLHFESPNPAINFVHSPFFVNTQLTPWPATDTPRRAGVSSFGIGGTNAHAIVEEAPSETLEPGGASRPWHLLVLSAKSETALTQQRQNLADYLSQQPTVCLADVAFTLAQGRQEFAHRWMGLVQTSEAAIQTLQAPPSGTTFQVQANRTSVVFLFPGQGAQVINMGRDLYKHEPVFREALDTCAQLLLPDLQDDLRQLLYPKADSPVDINQTQWAQPLLFSVEYALAQLWLSWGIKPEAMIGHSLGEYVAACLAGVFSLEEGLWLVAQRAKLMQHLPPGAMLAIPGTEAEITPWLRDGVVLAATNGGICTVSGELSAIADLEHQLTAAGQSVTRLQTSHAFHSPLVESMVADFRHLLQQISFHAPQRTYLSNVTGTWITAPEATDPEYWIQHLRQTVRFGEAVAQLLPDPNWIFLEVGPGRTLTALVRRHPNYTQAQPLLNSLLTTATAYLTEPQHVLQTLGQLWLHGVTPKWQRFYANDNCHRIPLPTYPFEGQRYWIDPPQGSALTLNFGLARNPDPSRWFYAPSWKQLPPLSLQPLATDDCWLLLIDRMGLGTALAESLKAAGQRVVTVAYGDRKFWQSADHVVKVGDTASFERLLLTLQVRQHWPQHILHLWSLDPGAADLRLDTVAKQTEAGLHALLSLVQAIGKVGQPQPLQLSVITNGSYNLLGTESLKPLKSLLLGAVKVIPQEYAQLSCRYVDLEEVFPHAVSRSQWLQTLLTELTTPEAPQEVAYRGRSRWIPTYEPISLSEPEDNPRLRSQGVYLITGGLGGIGLTLAHHLAQTVQARLVLVSRSPFPARRHWAYWCLTHPKEDPISQKIYRLRELEAYGAKVWVEQADVTDHASLEPLVASIEAVFGPIHGVIHCAGMADFGGIIQGRNRSDTDRILAAKVTGTLVLDRVFRNRPLDFWVMSSSLGTALYKTLFGQVGYSAANEFLSAFCEYKQQTTQTFTVAIHWTEWDEVGMAVDSRAERLKTKARAEEEQNWLVALTPEEGADAFGRILNQPQARIAVSIQDLQQLLQQQAQWSTNQFLESLTLEPDTNQPKQQRPELATAYMPAQTQLEALLIDHWETYLGIAPLGLDDSFYDLGGDSLLALGLLAQIQKKLSVNIPMTALLEIPTVVGLVTYLQTHAADTIAQWLIPLESTQPESTMAPLPNDAFSTPAPSQPTAHPPDARIPQPLAYPTPMAMTQLTTPAQPVARPVAPVVARLQAGSPQHPPLFFVHPIGGGISCYSPLARHLNRDCPFYGLRAIGLDQEAPPLADVPQMAACYIQTIRTIQPQGPYYLGGWSMGGVVAYEMALQLFQFGESVSGLILIDSPAPVATPRDPAIDFTVFARGLGFCPEQVDAFSQLLQSDSTALDMTLQRLLTEGQRIGLLPQSFALAQLQQLYTVFNAHSLALSNYTAAICPQRLPTLLLQAKIADHSMFSRLGPQVADHWTKLLGRSPLIRNLPGDHYTLVTEPQVALLSTHLNSFLCQIKPSGRTVAATSFSP